MCSQDKEQLMNNLTTSAELERQRKSLGRLPKDFEYPLFNSKQALESQRKNGYRTTASAAREIVDNAIEAGARNIHVVFDTHKEPGKGKREVVTAVAFIDDGSGMLPEMARYALTWGGGSHFEEHDFIGKFGFGLPNASLNQTRRVEVYTKTAAPAPFVMTFLDANEIQGYGVQKIDPGTVTPLPPFVAEYMERNSISVDHGTVVVWVKPDRLTYSTPNSLKEHLLDDFGVVYRYLLEGFSLTVEGTKVEMVDPLFLDPRSRYYLSPEKGGAQLADERSLAVAHVIDPVTHATVLKWLRTPEDVAELSNAAQGVIQYRIARFPFGFASQDTAIKLDEDSPKRLNIRKPRRGISFVRAGREIETVDVFPKSPKESANGLGRWPLLQGYAYHWGVEIRFDPVLDDVFGVTNDKQTIRPTEALWRLLASEEVELDRKLREENGYQEEIRKRTAPPIPPSNDVPSAAEHAAAMADSAVGKVHTLPAKESPEVIRRLKEEATKQAAQTGKSTEEVVAAIEQDAKRKPFKLEFVDAGENAPFYTPVRGPKGQFIAQVNRRHPFFTTLYADLLNLKGGYRAKEAVDVLLLTLCRAELICEDEVLRVFYEEQRKNVWSSYLGNALRILAQSLRSSDEPEEKITVQ
jgi:hypothetical protein